MQAATAAVRPGRPRNLRPSGRCQLAGRCHRAAIPKISPRAPSKVGVGRVFVWGALSAYRGVSRQGARSLALREKRLTKRRHKPPEMDAVFPETCVEEYS